MRRALLLYNPAAGSQRESRVRVVETIAAALRARGLEVETAATEGSGSAGRQAAASAADIVFACGGDGTVHDVLQGLAGEQREESPALGVIPLGTANALARDLRLPLDPVAAALTQLGYPPKLVPVGQIEWTDTDGHQTSRYFIAMAGAGPHAALVYAAADRSGDLAEGAFAFGLKSSIGRSAYYARSVELFLRQVVPAAQARQAFPRFLVEFIGLTDGKTHRIEAVSAIAVRVASLGGLFHPLAKGGAVDSPNLSLIVVRPPGNLALPLWFGMSWLGLARWNRFVGTFDVQSFRCLAATEETAPDLQADGEWLSRAGASVTLIPNALRLLTPPGA